MMLLHFPAEGRNSLFDLMGERLAISRDFSTGGILHFLRLPVGPRYYLVGLGLQGHYIINQGRHKTVPLMQTNHRGQGMHIMGGSPFHIHLILLCAA